MGRAPIFRLESSVYTRSAAAGSLLLCGAGVEWQPEPGSLARLASPGFGEHLGVWEGLQG